VNRWLLLKDVILTGTGVLIVLSQTLEAALGQSPSALIIGAGLALTVPSIADHVKALLPGDTGSTTSSSSRPSGSSQSHSGPPTEEASSK
jgi:hypothetical protein